MAAHVHSDSDAHDPPSDSNGTAALEGRCTTDAPAGGESTQVATATGGVKAFLDALPTPIRALLDLLLLSWVEPEDDFTMILRKIVVTTGLCMFVHPVSYIGYFVYLLTQGAPVGGPAALIVACCFSMFAWSALYFVARSLRSVPDLILDLWLVGTNIAFSLLVVSMPQYPATTCVMASAILTIVCNSPRRPLFLVWCSAMFLLEEYNNAVDQTGFEGLVPGARRGPMPERLVNHLSGFVIAATVLAALLMQTREHVHHVAAANASVEAAQRMARFLAKYDTAAVEKLIHKELRGGNAGQVNVALFEAFASIAENLDKYRPHLPNWMLDQADSLNNSDDDPDLRSISTFNSVRSDASDALHGSRTMSGSNGLGQDGSSGSYGRRSANDLRGGHGSGLGFDDPKPSKNGAGPRDDTGATQPAATAATSDHHGGTSAVSLSAVAVDASDTSSTVASDPSLARNQLLQRPAASLAGQDGFFQGKVAQAMICVGAHRSFDGSRGSANYTAAVDTMLERVLECAQSCGAALHSFIGDKLTLTWNATHRVPQPEIKMCRFLAQLRAAAAADAVINKTLALSGAGVCAESICRFGGSSKGQRTLHLSQPDAWYIIHSTLLHFACAAQAFVVDGWSARIARHEILHRDVEAFDVCWDRDPDALHTPIPAPPSTNGAMSASNSPSVSPTASPLGLNGVKRRGSLAALHGGGGEGEVNAHPNAPPDALAGSLNSAAEAGSPIGSFRAARHGSKRLQRIASGATPSGRRSRANYNNGASTKRRVVVASEILAERHHKEDEWMYVLQANDSTVDPNSVVSNALRLAVMGRVTEATLALRALDVDEKDPSAACAKAEQTGDEEHTAAAVVRTSLLVRRLTHRVAAAVRQGVRTSGVYPVPINHPVVVFALHEES